MPSCRFILFDCIETLIDLDPVPAPIDYARWAYEGSGLEKAWSGFEEFVASFGKARRAGGGRGSRLREEELADRFALVCADNSRLKERGLTPRAAAERLTRTFLKAYRARTFVHEDVHRCLPRLAPRFNLGVVSNFTVRGGIEALLDEHALAGFFKFIITSVGFGFRKPHPDIYRAAIHRCGCRAADIVFVGDDPACDYTGPQKLGMRAILFDRHYARGNESDIVRSFDDLVGRFV